MFAVCISGKRSKCYLMCISQKHPGNPLCVSQKYKESNSFPFLDANKQNNYVMFFLCFCGKQSTCFPNVFQANTDFTCFPSLFSWKTVTIPSSELECKWKNLQVQSRFINSEVGQRLRWARSRWDDEQWSANSMSN